MSAKAPRVFSRELLAADILFDELAKRVELKKP